MERTEQMYTLHMQLDFGKVKVGAPPTPHLTLQSRSHGLVQEVLRGVGGGGPTGGGRAARAVDLGPWTPCGK